MAHIDMDLARTFVTICEAGNFSRAAELVGRTPSAISLQVKKLEDLIGRTVFARDSRSVALTPDGEILLAYARRLLSLNDEALNRFRAPPLEGLVRLGAPEDSGIIILPQILKRFAATHSHVEVEVRLGASVVLEQHCRSGELDVVIINGREVTTPRARELHTESLVWVGLRHGRAATRTPLPLAVAEHGCPWRATALAELDKAGISYRVAYSSEQCQGQIAAVHADLAVAALPASVVAPPLERLDGKLPKLDGFRMFLETRDGAGPAAEALAEHVAENFRDRASQGLRIFA